ncbi:uncharacterized protein LOC103191216 [Callorhinchus milii]|uniref:uncharacterized protein LOC103191216 n=1 Tax=Callorhinchus milii TaxID=7868 RepID=UPI001C3FE35A|nr:uncharacterized protein LOC103191216 [Callorhinchus milii]
MTSQMHHFYIYFSSVRRCQEEQDVNTVLWCLNIMGLEHVLFPVITISLFGISAGDSVRQSPRAVWRLETVSVNISCDASTTADSISMLLFRHRRGERPAFLIQRHSYGKDISLTHGDSVREKVASVTEKEGGSVTMECHYSTSLIDHYLQWYREQKETPPRYVIEKHSGGATYKADFAEKRFAVELQTLTKSSSLTITQLELSDSAVYYCALKPHSAENQSETRTQTGRV